MQEIETIEGAGARTLNLDALRSFVAIEETGSFRLAAARVHRSPSAVSLQIAKLEETLGTRLLERNARRVALTGHGALLLRQARRILGLSDETMALFRPAALQGELRLAAPHDLGMSLVPQMLARLAERHPALRVEVHLGASEEVLRRFRSGGAGLALFNDAGPPQLAAEELAREPLAWLGRAGGTAAERDPLPLAVAGPGCAWREAALAALDAAGRRYRVAYASDTSMGQLAALRADLAVAALPRSLAGPDLAELPGDCRLPALPETRICAAGDGSPAAAAMIALAAEIAAGPPSR
ncbi:LysR family transcriptional regulator [Poseidonocella sp. HB161398]|uniref:LysR family transcriptional regulator n=1 Tax=Poseidonocella sp. HB161398 TaxID=2320855 RepID=UPI001F0DE203|nr:LysR family transcriptional regulator [Poseidonocella sp. HB161398]